MLILDAFAQLKLPIYVLGDISRDAYILNSIWRRYWKLNDSIFDEECLEISDNLMSQKIELKLYRVEVIRVSRDHFH